MQNNAKKKAKKALVYKPYKKGPWHSAAAARRGMRIWLYYLMFAFIYVLLGAALQFENTALRVASNLVLVLACGALMYMDGARLGESETALGEIALMREESGKQVSKADLANCYHPLKGLFIFAVGAALPLLITIPYAFLAEKQVYSLQALPSWVSSYKGNAEITLPLAYYNRDVSLHFADYLRMIARILIFPFANIATSDQPDLMLLMDRLSPLLACLPALGFPLGYLTGPQSRAMVHGDIAASNRRQQRRVRKAQKARKERIEKKNELI